MARCAKPGCIVAPSSGDYCPVHRPSFEIADLQAAPKQAQEELGRLRATGLGDCYCDTPGETPCAYCQVEQAQAERDAAIERGVRVLRLYCAYQAAFFSCRRRAARYEERAEAAKKELTEQRALAERRGEALRPFARHFIPSGGTAPGRLAKLDEAPPWTLEDFGRAYALTPVEALKEGD